MKHFQEETYGELIADVYDSIYPPPEPAAIDLLADLAGAGPALELGIGTGRYALPLQGRGVTVHGIDASPAMVQQLAARPQGDRITVTLGSFADFTLDQRFSLIYIVFNTFFGLLTQEDQISCFASVGRHLNANGVFLIEAFVPDLNRFQRDQNVSAINIEIDSVQLDVAKLDRAKQQITATHVRLSENGLRLFPVKLRYAWPSELDLMARLAGLRLQHRWSDWQQSPFDSKSQKHISVYTLAE